MGLRAGPHFGGHLGYQQGGWSEPGIRASGREDAAMTGAGGGVWGGRATPPVRDTSLGQQYGGSEWTSRKENRLNHLGMGGVSHFKASASVTGFIPVPSLIWGFPRARHSAVCFENIASPSLPTGSAWEVLVPSRL